MQKTDITYQALHRYIKDQVLEYLLTSAYELDDVIKNITDKSAMVQGK